MIAIVDEAEDAMVELLDTQRSSSEDAALDNAIDGLWALLRARLEGWASYERAGLHFLELDEQLALELDVETLRENAAQAHELAARLFAAGIDFVRLPWTEQAQHMANLHLLIQRHGLEQQLARVAGPELLPILRACQRRYDAMVRSRLGRAEAGTVDLRKLRAGLQRVINFYSQSVISMLASDGAEAVEIIVTSLHPIIALRQRVATRRRAALTGQSAEGDETTPGEVEAVEADEADEADEAVEAVEAVEA